MHAEYQVAIGGPPVRCGKPSKGGSYWSRGPAHHVDTEAERASIFSARDALGPSSSCLRRSERMFAAIPGDLAEQVIEPLRPAEQHLDHVRRPPVTDPGQRPASGDEPFSCSAMSGSLLRALTAGP